MVGADKSTELWWPPRASSKVFLQQISAKIILMSALSIYVVTRRNFFNLILFRRLESKH